MSVRRTVVALVGAVLLVPGCSDDPEPRFEPPASPSPSPSESASSAEPEAQTPEEFIREWVELDTEMQNSGDTGTYLAASKSCSSCQDFADRVETVYADGGSITTGGWAVKSITQRSSNVYRLRVDSRPTVVVERSDGDEQRFPGGPVLYELALRESSTGWQVTDWYEVAQ